MTEWKDVTICNKIDTTGNWNCVEDTATPGEGELIIYQDAGNAPRLKFGDGNKTLKDIPFISNVDIGAGEESIQQITMSKTFDIRSDYVADRVADKQSKGSITTGALGEFSTELGGMSQAKGISSVAQGIKTIALGNYSHSEGNETFTEGIASHAEGIGTIATDEGQHVEGRWNIVYEPDDDGYYKYAHIVGNGTGDNKRSNAHTLDWDGNAWYAGNVKVGSEGKKLSTEEFVNGKLKETADELQESITDVKKSVGELSNLETSVRGEDIVSSINKLKEYTDTDISELNDAVSYDLEVHSKQINDVTAYTGKNKQLTLPGEKANIAESLIHVDSSIDDLRSDTEEQIGELNTEISSVKTSVGTVSNIDDSLKGENTTDVVSSINKLKKYTDDKVEGLSNSISDVSAYTGKDKQLSLPGEKGSIAESLNYLDYVISDVIPLDKYSDIQLYPATSNGYSYGYQLTPRTRLFFRDGSLPLTVLKNQYYDYYQAVAATTTYSEFSGDLRLLKTTDRTSTNGYFTLKQDGHSYVLTNLNKVASASTTDAIYETYIPIAEYKTQQFTAGSNTKDLLIPASPARSVVEKTENGKTLFESLFEYKLYRPFQLKIQIPSVIVTELMKSTVYLKGTICYYSYKKPSGETEDLYLNELVTIDNIVNEVDGYYMYIDNNMLTGNVIPLFACGINITETSLFFEYNELTGEYTNPNIAIITPEVNITTPDILQSRTHTASRYDTKSVTVKEPGYYYLYLHVKVTGSESKLIADNIGTVTILKQQLRGLTFHEI